MEQAPFELVSDRLVVRLLARRDIPEFVRYRNIDDIARYQDWELPYTVEMAEELVANVAELGGPTLGEWVQLAIEHDGVLVGDIAVWVDDEGQLASLGYTVAPEHQGHNYAAEATALIVDWLFEVAGVHRIAATLDPRNIASARVLERTGFHYIGTARSAALIRGEWQDDTRFEFTLAAWRAWRRRPVGPPVTVRFVEVTHDNIHAVGEIEVSHSQRRFVSGVMESIADAAHPPVEDGVAERPWYRAIEADGRLVGFIMLALPNERHATPVLWRLLVDTWHQRRGIARRAIGLAADMLRDGGCTELEVGFVDEAGGPESYYTELGFTRTGRVDADGQVWAKADLSVLCALNRR